MTPEELIAFETDIAAEFNAAKIRSPVHLYDGNETAIIKAFQQIRPQDWVLCSWRSHYQCLLKGVPPALLKAEIMAGRSISLCFPEYRILSSAIVGGVVPIAAGIALGIQRTQEDARVYCFMGEMTAETGIAHECVKYARNHRLPITWVIEDNGKSVCTYTKQAWNLATHWWEEKSGAHDVIHYRYQSQYPHAGAGARVQF
jgi:TPP-dependent pyruvate/acetoin dehydrogenase alpha subunit